MIKVKVWKDHAESWREAFPGVRRRILGNDEKGMLVLYRFKRGSSVPLHQHHNTQYGIVIQGRGRFEASNGVLTVKTGDSYYIPSNEEHSFTTEEETTVLDVFVPAREDFSKEIVKADVE